jgi:hypothetical protein
MSVVSSRRTSEEFMDLITVLILLSIPFLILPACLFGDSSHFGKSESGRLDGR